MLTGNLMCTAGNQTYRYKYSCSVSFADIKKAHYYATILSELINVKARSPNRQIQCVTSAPVLPVTLTAKDLEV